MFQVIGCFNFIDMFILFGGALSILTAFAQLIRPNRNFENKNFFIVFSITGIFLIYFYYHFSLKDFDYNFAFAPLLFFVLYTISPIYYASCHVLLIGRFKHERKHLIHLLPAVAAFFITLLNSIGIFELNGLINISGAPELNSVQYLTALLWILHFTCYLAVILIKFFLFRSFYSINKDLYGVVFTLLFLSVIIILLAIGQIFYIMILAKIALALITIIIITWFMFMYIYPDVYSSLDKLLGYKPLKNKNRSFLKGVDTELLNTNMTEIMKNEKIYCDDDITLNKFASMLSITPHQLSEFLNREMNISFNNFINYHRIEEAKKLLISEKDRTILSIAMAVGFNSKSVFYSAFMKFTGLSPVRFQKDNQSRGKL